MNDYDQHGSDENNAFIEGLRQLMPASSGLDSTEMFYRAGFQAAQCEAVAPSGAWRSLALAASFIALIGMPVSYQLGQRSGRDTAVANRTAAQRGAGSDTDRSSIDQNRSTDSTSGPQGNQPETTVPSPKNDANSAPDSPSRNRSQDSRQVRLAKSFSQSQKLLSADLSDLTVAHSGWIGTGLDINTVGSFDAFRIPTGSTPETLPLAATKPLSASPNVLSQFGDLIQ